MNQMRFVQMFYLIIFSISSKCAKTNLTNKGQNMFSVTSSSSLDGLMGRTRGGLNSQLNVDTVDLSDLKSSDCKIK